MSIDIDFISTFSIAIPTLVGIFLFASIPALTRMIVVYVWITAVLESITLYLGIHSINNLYLFHIHTFIEFAFIVILYGNLILIRGKDKVLGIITGLFLIASLLLLLFHQDITEFNSVQRHVEGFLVTMIVLFYFYERSSRVGKVSNSPINILSVVLLVYFNGNIFLFMFADEVLTIESNDLWVVHGILNILLNLTFSYVIIAQRIRKND